MVTGVHIKVKQNIWGFYICMKINVFGLKKDYAKCIVSEVSIKLSSN